GQDEPIDGDTVATGTGWLAWCEWVDGHADSHESAARLCQDGEGWPLEGLEQELAGLLKEPAPAAVHSITANLLKLVSDRPEGTGAIIITDGSDDLDEEDEDEED